MARGTRQPWNDLVGIFPTFSLFLLLLTFLFISGGDGKDRNRTITGIFGFSFQETFENLSEPG